MNLHFYAPHVPMRARSEDLFWKFMKKPGDPVLGQGMTFKDLHAKYATMLASIDDNVGRLIRYLDDNNLRENTIIFFTSDNGYNGNKSANKKMRGCKGYIYEGGIRVPAFINWPGHVSARRSRVPVSVLDYYPTLCELGGVRNTRGKIDGNSLVPLFKTDDQKLMNRPLYWQLNSQWKHGTCSVIRKGNYKLIQFLATGELELYDLAADLLESKNLVQTHPEVAQALVAELVEWRQQNHVPLPPNAVVNMN